MSNSSFKKEKKAWEENILDPGLEKFPERKDSFRTGSGDPVERVYFPENPGDEYLEKLGFPGEYPYTRGVQPTMYRGRFWTMRLFLCQYQVHSCLPP